MTACMPLSLKYSPIAHPEYGARYCRGAASEAVAQTMMVYFIASTKLITFYYDMFIQYSDTKQLKSING